MNSVARPITVAIAAVVHHRTLPCVQAERESHVHRADGESDKASYVRNTCPSVRSGNRSGVQP